MESCSEMGVFEAVHDLNKKKEPNGGLFSCFFRELELFEKLASGAGDVNSAGDSALTVLDPLHDTGGFGALRAIGALLGVHDLLTVACFGNLRHNLALLVRMFRLARCDA